MHKKKVFAAHLLSTVFTEASQQSTVSLRELELTGLAWQAAFQTLTMTLSRTNSPHRGCFYSSRQQQYEIRLTG